MCRSSAVVLASLFVAACAARAEANVRLHYLFTDNAVLQRDAAIPVWGKGAPGERITVTLDGRTATAVADTGGAWMVSLAPHPAGGPCELVATGGVDTVRVRNLLIGDVWLCSGQSNMAFRMQDDISVAREDIAAANDSLIRHFFVSDRDLPRPQDELREGKWDVCSPATVGAFTAVGYFLARDLRQKLRVPIGIISSSVGGTKAEKWIGSHALSRVPEFRLLIDEAAAARERHRQALLAYQLKTAEHLKTVAELRARGKPIPKAPPPPHDYPPAMPSGHYNGMIAPLMPFAIRGVAWYQGESNADDPAAYRKLFPLLITSWREDWGRPDLPFIYVQLANYDAPDSTRGKWAELRDAQSEALSLPNTGMALAIDVGESHDIHPRNKKAVGERLALVAEALVYGLPVESAGPTLKGVTRDGGKVRISFDHAGNGLEMRGSTLEGFMLAGMDSVLHPAQAVISGDDVLVWSDDIAEPRTVAYAWADDPPCNLYNKPGLPARPFRAQIP